MTKEECEIETSKAIMEMRTNIAKLEKENAELRNTAEFQQSSNMNRYFENKKLKDENTGLKEKVSYLEDNLRVARKDRKNLQLKVGKGLKEFIKDCPHSALKLYANGYYAEQLTKAKEIIKRLNDIVCGRSGDDWELIEQAEQFISEVEK